MSLINRFFKNPAYLTLFLIALVIFGLSACSYGRKPPAEHIARAVEFHEEGILEAAVIELKNALRQAPDNVEARFLLGQIYVDAGDGPSAEKEIQQAVKHGLAPAAAAIPLTRALLLQAKYQQAIEVPFDSQDLTESNQAALLALQGNAYFGLGQLEKAAQLYDKALSKDSQAPEAAAGKARVAVARKRFDEAREWLAKVQKTSPDFAPAWSLLGDIEHFEKNFKQAESAYSEAIKHGNNNLLVLLKRANNRIALQNFEGARADIDEASRKAKPNPNIGYLKGLLNFREQKYDLAQKNFQDVLALFPNHWPTIYYLGIVNYQKGNLEQANRQLAQYLYNYPSSDIAAKALAMVRLRQANYTGAESVLNPVVKRSPDDELALALLSSAVLRQGNAAESAEYQRQILAKNPQSVQAHMNLATAFLALDEKEKALAELGKVTQLDADFHQAELQIIVTHLNAREFDLALAAAKQLLEKQPQNADAIILMGGAYLGTGDVPKARNAFIHAVEVSPRNYNAVQNLASLEIRSGNVESARNLFLDFLKHQPGHLDALMKLGALELSEGQYEAAKSWVEQAIKAHPDAAAPRISLASYYLKMGEPQKALEVTTEIKDKYPNNISLLYVMGKAQMIADSPESSLKTFQELVRLKPESAEMHFLLAQAHIRTGNMQRARDELDASLKLEPTNLNTSLAMARLLIKQEDAEHARDLINKLMENHSAHPDVLLVLGQLEVLEKRYKDAIRAFNSAREKAPRNYTIVQNLASAQWRMRDYDGSFATLTSWLKDHPEHKVAQFELANSYLMLNRVPEAKAAFEKTVSLWPENALALNNLAWLIRTENPDEALTYAKQAVALKPEAAIFKDTLGEILFEQGKTKEAIAELRNALTLAPDNLDIRYHLALALVRDGSTDEARMILTEILAEKTSYKNRAQAQSLLEYLNKK